MPRADDLSDERRFPEVFDLVASMEQKIDLISRRIGLPNCTLTEFITITNTNTGVRLVGENFKRRALIVFNNSAGDVYIHTRQLNRNNATQWMKIPTGGFWEPLNVPTNELYAIGTSGSQEVVGYEGT